VTQFFYSSDSAETYNHVHMISIFIMLKCWFRVLAVTVNRFMINMIHEMIFQDHADW